MARTATRDRPPVPSSPPAVASTTLSIVVVSPDDLRRLLREEIVALLQQQVRESAWITADQVAQMLGYRRQYVAELVRRHGLPSHQPSGRGGRHMFRRAEIEAWVLARTEKR